MGGHLKVLSAARRIQQHQQQAVAINAIEHQRDGLTRKASRAPW